MMWQSLQKLMALPKDTVVYCGHEYTQANARFALTIEPKNEALQGAGQGGRSAARRRQADAADQHRLASWRPTRSCARTSPPSRSGSAWWASPIGRCSARSASARTGADTHVGARGAHRRASDPSARTSRRIPKAATIARRSAIGSASAARAQPRRPSTSCCARVKVSRWHRVDAAEVWHWLCRRAARAQRLPPTAAARPSGSAPILPPASGRRRWCRPAPGKAPQSLGAWTLVGCTVAPGFEFAGFELAPPNLDRIFPDGGLIRLSVTARPGGAVAAVPVPPPSASPAARAALKANAAGTRPPALAGAATHMSPATWRPARALGSVPSWVGAIIGSVQRKAGQWGS